MKTTRYGLTSEQIESIADKNSSWQRQVDEFKKSQTAFKRGLTSISNALKEIDSHLSAEQREALATAKSILRSYQNDFEVIARRAGRMVVENEQARKIEERELNKKAFHTVFDDAIDPYAVFKAIGTAISEIEYDYGSGSINTAARLLNKIDCSEKYSEAAGLEMTAAARGCHWRVHENIIKAVLAAKLKSSVSTTAATPTTAPLGL